MLLQQGMDDIAGIAGVASSAAASFGESATAPRAHAARRRY
jgi:hypothetical protein